MESLLQSRDDGGHLARMGLCHDNSELSPEISHFQGHAVEDSQLPQSLVEQVGDIFGTTLSRSRGAAPECCPGVEISSRVTMCWQRTAQCPAGLRLRARRRDGLDTDDYLFHDFAGTEPQHTPSENLTEWSLCGAARFA